MDPSKLQAKRPLRERLRLTALIALEGVVLSLPRGPRFEGSL